ncbi:MAG: hypothetical protein D6767_05425 [Candidatus Hydrogenedentota bacterium]|nr:MAG: hypothetical protein D6767_05425 [Candidatus Hydrogenedentota bacterium]
MKKFRFKLDSYLKILEIQEKQKLAELAEVAGKVSAQKNQINRYYEESQNWLQESASLVQIGEVSTDVWKQRQYIYSYLGNLRKNADRAQRELETLQEELQEKQKAVMEARKKKRTIEILREKKYKEYQKEVSRQETAQLDEFNQTLASKTNEVKERLWKKEN